MSQYVYAMALLEIGIVALAKLDETENDILDTVRQLYEKIRQAPPLP